MDELKNIIIEEKIQRNHFKYIISLFVVFCQASDEDDLTEPPVVLKSEVFTALDASNIEDQLNLVYIQLSNKIEEFIANGSGWVLHHLCHIDLGILMYDPLNASSYLPLPPKLKNQHSCINIKNDDEKCFLWTVLASLHPASQHPERVFHYQQFEGELNMSGIDYPVKLKNITKFERQNEVSINVFGYEDGKVFPVRITDGRNELTHHVNLLLISSEHQQSHYVLIKNLSRLLSSQLSNHNGKKWFCDFCIQGFSSEAILLKHVEFCKVKTFSLYVCIERCSFINFAYIKYGF